MSCGISSESCDTTGGLEPEGYGSDMECSKHVKSLSYKSVDFKLCRRPLPENTQ